MDTDILFKHMREGRISESCETLRVYPSSFHRLGECRVVMYAENSEKRLLVSGDGPLSSSLAGMPKQGYKICGLTHENRMVINTFFDYTVPRPAGKAAVSMGLGDRLGTATAGHLKAVKERAVFPVLAQQSKRELDLTGRTFSSVLDDAVFAVFREGYRRGFGADGDHLKTIADINEALDLGYSMITVDCSEKINADAAGLDTGGLKTGLAAMDEGVVRRYRGRYLDRSFPVGKGSLAFDEDELARLVLTYDGALAFIAEIYARCIVPRGKTVDLEISVDETTVPTSPAAHYFIAAELADAGIPVTGIAPRFPGEFQKGIDYIGDVSVFEKEYRLHQAVADSFGHRLSVHSGSDKFAVFGLIGEISRGRFHLKTSGTHWLEALRMVAAEDSALYRDLHRCALEGIDGAKRLYHISADLGLIKPLDTAADGELSAYLDDPNARQALHISYGTILNHKSGDGVKIYRDALYDAIRKHENAYENGITAHTVRHLDALGIR